MEVVLDANIIFSALIKDSYIRHFLLLSGYAFYLPEFVFEEISKHINTLIEKTMLTETEIKQILDEIILRTNIKILPFAEFEEYAEKAKQISPDPNDIHYFALALKLKCFIWSNDKKLKEQNVIKIYSTEEIMKLI